MTLRTALVTGASSGLGRELVRQLVRDRGMTVLATARRLDRLEDLAAELPTGRVLIEAGDLADDAFRARLWARAESLPGGLDLLVNNAGLGHYAPFEDQDAAVRRQIIEINIVALFDLTAKAVRSMRARGSGQILQVSSVLGFVGLPYSADYVASKHAVNGLVKSLRYELRGSGVRVWAACPGQFVSEFRQSAMGGNEPGHDSKGEPVERVARGIVRGLDRRSAFCFPTTSAMAIVESSRWLSWPFEWMMARWAPGHFRKELGVDRPESSRGPGT
ncbi:MAG: SDR family NAD(P)-dependent oxidoreductase [Isosphaeraceae bacterium]